jgi:hypothetical protein
VLVYRRLLRTIPLLILVLAFFTHGYNAPSGRSIFKGLKPLKMDLTEGSETSANINQTLGIHQKVDTVNIYFAVLI